MHDLGLCRSTQLPDLSAAARMLDLSKAPETEVREALGPGFPKPPNTFPF